jgi:hypothetical protein
MHKLINELVDVRIIAGTQGYKGYFTVAAILYQFTNAVYHFLLRKSPDGSVDDPCLTEPAASGASTLELDGTAVMDNLYIRNNGTGDRMRQFCDNLAFYLLSCFLLMRDQTGKCTIVFIAGCIKAGHIDTRKSGRLTE